MLTGLSKWRWAKWMFLCTLLQYISFAEGEIYNNKRLKPVTTFHTPLNTICVVPLSDRPRVMLKVDLMVISATNHDIIKAGFVSIKNKLLQPIHSQHRLTVQHIVDDATLHILKVLLDGSEVEFVQSPTYDWSHFYHFHHISLSLRGIADISPCEHPTTLQPGFRPTTPTTTTTPPPPPTTVTTTRPPQTVYPYFPYDTLEYEEPTMRDFEDHTTTPPSTGELPEEDEVLYGREPMFPVGEPTYTNLSRNATFDDESDSDTEGSDDDEPWWRFVYILGDYKRIPLLLILIIIFCVGAGMGSVCTIICEQYCCCRDDHSNKNSEYDGDEFRHFSPTDYMRPSANATIVGTVDNSNRLSKENISHPLPPGGSRSRGSDYHTPYQQQQRERYLSNSTDETLPLNMPLPQDNQRLKNGNYNQYNKYQDTYQ